MTVQSRNPYIFGVESVHLCATPPRSLMLGAALCPCLMHRRSLPSASDPGRHRSTIFCLVRPQTTPYHNRSALILFVTSQIDDCPHKPTQVFPACFILTRTLPEKTSQWVTHPEIAPSQARLTWEFLRLSYQKEDASYWYR